MENKYPECDKMVKVQSQAQAIGEFLEWLDSKERRVCEWVEGTTDAARIARAFNFGAHEEDEEEDNKPNTGWYPITFNIEKLLAEYFNIDLQMVEKEKRQILDEIRKTNEDK